jgi:hypothetical protein
MKGQKLEKAGLSTICLKKSEFACATIFILSRSFFSVAFSAKKKKYFNLAVP